MNSLYRLIATSVVGLMALSSVKASAGPADSLVIRFANRTRMVIYAPDKASIQALSNYDLNKIVREMGMQLDSVPGGKAAISRDGTQYLKDTVLVVTKKKNGVTIVINDSGDTTQTDSARNHRDYTRTSARRGVNSWRRSIDFQIGLDTWVSRPNQAPGTMVSPDLRPLGSRYFAVAFSQRPTLIDGKRTKLSLYYAAEAAWSNTMFQEDILVSKGPADVQFTPSAEPLKKSKLTTFALQIPVVPRLSFYNSSGRKVFHIGLGGFVGYRLDSYTKIKRQNDDKSHEHGNFYLNDLRYGLVGHLGIVKTNLFVKYDLNPVFQAGKGPDARALSFGISF
jgi:Outer membrane protein beta-barrel domain